MRLRRIVESGPVPGPSGRTAFELDPGISDLVRVLNASGYVTVWSCSGLVSDHPGGRSNMGGRGGEWDVVGPPEFTFYSESVTPGLRRVLRGLGFRIKQNQRERPGVSGLTTATLGSHPEDGEIVRVLAALGEWARGNPRESSMVMPRGDMVGGV